MQGRPPGPGPGGRLTTATCPGHHLAGIAMVLDLETENARLRGDTATGTESERRNRDGRPPRRSGR
jgi:hypothetical protein